MTACRICGSASYLRLQLREMMFGLRDEFEYIRCSDCGCMQIAEYINDMTRYYPNDYHKPVDVHQLFAASQQPALLRLAQREIERYFTDLPVNTESRILDVGCGAGRLVGVLLALGYHRVTGVDPLVTSAFVGQSGLPLLSGELQDIEGEWDVIMMHHVFEHLREPRRVLAKAKSLLAPSGVCLIRIPIIATAWDLYGANWVQADAPRHLYLHTEASFRLLVAGCGFNIAYLRYDSTEFQFWGSEQYCQGIPLKAPESYAVCPEKSLFTATQIAEFVRRAHALNQLRKGDQVAVCLSH